jgi:hypothetical protein
VTKNYGGFAIAVHNPENEQSLGVCRELVSAQRIDFFADADYRSGRKLEQRVRTIVDLIIARIQFAREHHHFKSEMDSP